MSDQQEFPGSARERRLSDRRKALDPKYSGTERRIGERRVGDRRSSSRS
ncbi:MAG: hypothetical protein WBO17_12145 [Sphingorhabdus sp.]